jgi:nicotinate-nucleotide pyrophosphorylase (carboxylating)
MLQSKEHVSDPSPTAANLAQGLLQGVRGMHRAVVTATEPGLLAGLNLVDRNGVPTPAGEWRIVLREGAALDAGTVIIEVTGTAAELIVAEDYVLGPLGFASGIAKRANLFAQAAPPGLSIACGGWKKLPLPLKPLLRAGLAVAGVLPRLVAGEFIYVSKNAVRLIGSVSAAISAGRALNHGPVAVQVCNVEETLFAARAGAGIVMVDTAQLQDLADAHRALIDAQLRDRVVLAFGGGVRIEDLVPAHEAGAQAVDVGRAILDAPLLDMRMEVLE